MTDLSWITAGKPVKAMALSAVSTDDDFVTDAIFWNSLPDGINCARLTYMATTGDEMRLFINGEDEEHESFHALLGALEELRALPYQIQELATF
jgi:hypothetical protein